MIRSPHTDNRGGNQCCRLPIPVQEEEIEGWVKARQKEEKRIYLGGKRRGPGERLREKTRHPSCVKESIELSKRHEGFKPDAATECREKKE